MVDSSFVNDWPENALTVIVMLVLSFGLDDCSIGEMVVGDTVTENFLALSPVVENTFI